MQVEHPTGEIVTSVYDPDGHRVAQDDGVATQQFVYDGNNLLQERDDVGTVEADYTYVPQEYARYVSQQREAESRFYHASGIQDVTQLTDAGETVTDDYRFDAWGKPLATTGSTENPHTYKGEAGYQSAPQLSAEESTYYLHHRVLPSQGRFLSEDPLDDDANAYRYVRNNPVNAVDPSGLDPIRIPTASGDVVIPDSAQTGYIGRLATLLRDAESSGNTSFATTVRRTLLVEWNEQRGLHSEHQLYSAQQKQLNRLSQTFEPFDIITRPLGHAAAETAKRVGETTESVGDQLVWIDGKLVDAAQWAGDRYTDARNLSISTGYETRSPEAYRRFQQYLEYNAITHGSDVARELSHRPWDPEYITPNEQAEFDMAVGGTLEVLTGGLGKSGPFAREALGHTDDAFHSTQQISLSSKRIAQIGQKPPFPRAEADIRGVRRFNPNYTPHANAAAAEESLARTVHNIPDEAVVRWGDPIGAHGNDVISVNVRTGDVTLWDAKFRSGSVEVRPSKTFARDPVTGQPTATFLNAIDEAIQTIENNQTLPLNIRQQALDNLLNGNVRTRTAGFGNARNSALQ